MAACGNKVWRDDIAPYWTKRRGRPWVAAPFLFMGCGWIFGGERCGFGWVEGWAEDGRGGRSRA